MELMLEGLVFTAGFMSLAHAAVFSLETRNITELMGLIQSPGYNLSTYPWHPAMDIWLTIEGPLGHVSLVSFIRLHFGEKSLCTGDKLIALYKGGKSDTDMEWTTCGYPVPLPEVYEEHLMHLRYKKEVYTELKFQILYSFHQRSVRPARVTSGLWNCSTPQWSDFERHFRCNLDTECETGEDEAPCFYTGHCGQGYLTLDGRCYSYFKDVGGKRLSWRDSDTECRLRGGYLVSLNTPGEWQAVVDVLLSRVFIMHIHVGLTEASSVVPFMLPRYDALRFKGNSERTGRRCCGSVPVWQHVDSSCTTVQMCNTWHALTCPAGHRTLAFLACDEQSACWSGRHGYIENEACGVPSRAACPATVTSVPDMFECNIGSQRVPYSLVCDYRQQCVDNSDESFCVFPACSDPTPLRCAGSTQCVPRQTSCNGQEECINGADEALCAISQYGPLKTLPPPSVVNFQPFKILSDSFSFVITPLPGDSHVSDGPSPCPETHFQCPPDGYCLPVFVRCNGVNDCPRREDEAGCDSDVSCPGFYRCRSSSVCLHPSHVCDGMYQYPQQDDELFCNLTCPRGCTCHGLAFTCPEPFHAGQYLDVRFVDASDSGMTPIELKYNTMLIHLSLSRCKLDSVFNMSFPNLRSLDLSHNKLSIITTEHLRGMMKLQFLTLSNNPLKDLFPIIEQFSFSVIKSLDLSGVVIKQLNTRIFSSFPGLQALNLSHCDIEDVVGGGFHSASKFRILDIIGCPLTQFPRDLLSRLDQLQAVYADNFRLCCPDTLPTAFNLANCKAPFDEVSSCESLLRSGVYTVFLSIFATLTLMGNFGCFVLRSFYLKSSTSGFVVFVTHLSVSDFLMGVYLAVIGVADRLYKGDYQWEDFSWRHSTACEAAGFLSLMSNEISAFIICLITLDRFLVLRFPFSRLHFKALSAHLTCLVVWVVAFTISVIPMTPVTSHWSFYSHTGICIPLPVTRGDFAGRQYAFGVLIVFNFILFVFIALGQTAIYVSVRANSLSTTDSTKKSNDLRLARRLVSVAVSDFLCWFPIGLLGLLASSGVPISGEVNVGMAILVLPLNSAINPFLYTINIVLERRRRSRDEKLLDRLTMQICQEDPKTGWK